MPVTILVVEPDEHNRLLLRLYLEGAGCAVATAAATFSALRAVRRGADLVTLERLDDGWALAHRLRSTPATADIPIVLVTMVDDAEREVGVPVQGCVRKPFTRRALLEAVARALSSRSARGSMTDS
jgi:CheY-like chemotaxis protein